MTDKTYSTGQVSGMTEIPIRTMQDYVKSFREFFSEAARKTAKGRHFTELDIKRLLIIKRARSQRIQDEEIKKIFTGESYWPLATEYQQDDVKRMAVNAYESFQRAAHLIEVCDKMVTETEQRVIEIQAVIAGWEEKYNGMAKELAELHAWKIHVMKTDPTLNPYIDKDLEQVVSTDQQPKRKGLFGSRG
jgi:DNA-binding transcriptional MerR regulator